MNKERTHTSDATRDAEANEAHALHGDYAAPEAEEEVALEEREVDPDVRTHYQKMTQLGAENAGEGRI